MNTPSHRIRFLAWLTLLTCAVTVLLWLQNKAASHVEPQAHLVRLERIRSNPEERLRAIGRTDELSPQLERALDPGVDFNPLPQPHPGDWLWQFAEPGQTFPDFRKYGVNVPNSVRGIIYLQPLGAFPEDGNPSLDELRVFATAYFGSEVSVLPAILIEDTGITSRANPHSGQRQLLTGDILRLLKRNLPTDAYCMLAVTLVDLYPESAWNFVFGQATLRDRVGVFSLARYDPRFYGAEHDQDSATTLFRRSCKVLAHETGHMFGIHHCIYFDCLMNGCNSLGESDTQPIHLCPVDLRKLQHSVGFDVVARYRELERFYEAAGFADEAKWVNGRQ